MSECDRYKGIALLAFIGVLFFVSVGLIAAFAPSDQVVERMRACGHMCGYDETSNFINGNCTCTPESKR